MGTESPSRAVHIPRGTPPPNAAQKAALAAVEITAAGLLANPRDSVKLKLHASAQEQLRQLMRPRVYPHS